MKQRDTALAFVERFCAGDIGGLHPLLTADVHVEGPLHQSESRAGYLESLRRDPPQACGYRILSITESEDAVSVYYRYEKSDAVITIAQLFEFRREKISGILLVFDGRGFT